MMDDVLGADIHTFDCNDGQIITIINNNADGCDTPLVHHVLETIPSSNNPNNAQKKNTPNIVTDSSPCCLVCNAKLGVSARGAMNIFSEHSKTSHRQLNLNDILGSIVSRDFGTGDVHSDLVCRKCFKLVDDIDSLENQLVEMKHNVVSKYTRTLAVVKQIDENRRQQETLDLEADAALTKDDRDFRICMSSGSRGGKRKRGRGRRNANSVIKVEVKEELEDELLGLNAVSTYEVFQNQKSFNLLNGNKSKPISNPIDNEPLTQDVTDKDTDILIVENMLSGGVMEVSGLDLEDDGCDTDLQISNVCTLNDSLNQPSTRQETIPNNETDKSPQMKHKCCYCSYMIESAAEIETHIRENHADEIFTCEDCNSIFATKAELTEHSEIHEGKEKTEKLFNCKHCPRQFEFPRELKEHQRVHTNKLTCNLCPRKFRSANTLQEHYNVHTGNRPYACDQCDKTFTSKHVLKTHMKTHSVRDRPHQCQQCNKSFFTVHHLYEHLNVHGNAKSFICDICGKGFTTQRGLDLHGLTHTRIKNYACKICNKRFARKTEVDDHERTHTGEKPFQCEICGATFCQRSNLQSHKKATHYEEKKYQCSHCSKAFKRRRLLVYHEMSVHTGERPYKCSHCSSSFVYPEHYRKHLRIHTGEKPFKCDVCGKAFNSRDNRNAHKFIHSDKKPYECCLCGAGFMRRPMIVTHLQLHDITKNIESNIKINSPNSIDTENKTLNTSSPPVNVRLSKPEEESSIETALEDQIQFVRGDVNDGSRSVHLLDDFPRYIIQAPGGRTDDTMGHILASLQGQVVELTTEQIAQVVSEQQGQVEGTVGLQVQVAGELRPFQLQLEQSDREVPIQTEGGQVLKEVTATIISSSSTNTSSSQQYHTSNAFIGPDKTVQFDSTISNSALRKFFL